MLQVNMREESQSKILQSIRFLYLMGFFTYSMKGSRAQMLQEAKPIGMALKKIF